MSAPRLFGSQAKQAISSAEPPKLEDEDALLKLMRIKVGPHASRARLTYHLRINGGRLHWAVNSYFREACAGNGQMDFEPRSMRECAAAADHQGATLLSGGAEQDCRLRDEAGPSSAGPVEQQKEEEEQAGEEKQQQGDEDEEEQQEDAQQPSADGSSPVGIGSLPASVLEKVLRHCRAADVASVAVANRALGRAATSDQVWQALYLERWGQPQPNSVLVDDVRLVAAGESPGEALDAGFGGTMQRRFRRRLHFELEMRCLKCGDQKVIPLVFGFPSPQLVANQQRGRLLLGGDYLADGEPHREPCWTCGSCGIRYTRFPHAPAPEQGIGGGAAEAELLRGITSLPPPTGRLMH